MTAAPMNEEAKRRRRLLRRGARIKHPAAKLQPVARSFVHRVFATDRIRVLLAQPAEALVLVVAHLLVGGRGEDEVAGRPEALAR